MIETRLDLFGAGLDGDNIIKIFLQLGQYYISLTISSFEWVRYKQT